MQVRIVQIAQAEYKEAKAYYELEQSGLGLKFEQEIIRTFERIKQFPSAWPIERSEIRKCFVSKFPYKILYSLQDQNIIVLAFANQHRRPDHWIDRTDFC